MAFTVQGGPRRHFPGPNSLWHLQQLRINPRYILSCISPDWYSFFVHTTPLHSRASGLIKLLKHHLLNNANCLYLITISSSFFTMSDNHHRSHGHHSGSKHGLKTGSGSGSGSHGHSGGSSSGPKYSIRELWTCCWCPQSSGMDKYATPGCPICSHFRCDYCVIERVKLPIRRGQ